MDGPAIHSDILAPLLIMIVGFCLLYLTLLIVRIRSEIAAMRIRNIRLGQVQG